ncbi:MAG: hypothetical protein AAFQ47_07825 [Pseudomonadota bacterium]
MTVDNRAICGAINNADWYEAVFSAHGLRYRRLAFAFVAEDTPPPYYSKLTVLSPEENANVLLELAKLATRFAGTLSLKDSFCQLGLAQNGFESLFEASWLWRAPRQVSVPRGWEKLSNAKDLLLWEECWKRNGSPTDQRMFPETLLARDDVNFFGRRANDRFIAGCIVNRSAESIGLSNVFAETPSEAFFAQAADTAASVDGDLPVVGYESGDELVFAHQADFDTVGQLRILVTRQAEF